MNCLVVVSLQVACQLQYSLQINVELSMLSRDHHVHRMCCNVNLLGLNKNLESSICCHLYLLMCNFRIWYLNKLQLREQSYSLVLRLFKFILKLIFVLISVEADICNCTDFVEETIFTTLSDKMKAVVDKFPTSFFVPALA